MKIKIIKNKIVFPNSGYIPNEDLLLVIPHFDGNDTYYKINKGIRQKVENRTIKIPKEIFESGFTLELNVINQQKNFNETYKSDKISLKKAFLIGESPENEFPATLQKILRDISILKNDIKDQEKTNNFFEKRIKNLEEQGDIV